MPSAKGSKEPKLNDAIRSKIVTRLAMYDRVVDVQDAIFEEHEIIVSHTAIRHYDPSNGTRLAKKWVDLFHETRTQFLNETAGLPIAQRAWRLRRLQEDYERTRLTDPDTARKQLEQAAKETANFYKPTKAADDSQMGGGIPETERTSEESRNMLSDRLSEAFTRLPKGGVAKVKGSRTTQ